MLWDTQGEYSVGIGSFHLNTRIKPAEKLFTAVSEVTHVKANKHPCSSLQAQLSYNSFQKENSPTEFIQCLSQKTQLAHVHIQQQHILRAVPQLQTHVRTTQAEQYNLGASLE